MHFGSPGISKTKNTMLKASCRNSGFTKLGSVQSQLQIPVNLGGFDSERCQCPRLRYCLRTRILARRCDGLEPLGHANYLEMFSVAKGTIPVRNVIQADYQRPEWPIHGTPQFSTTQAGKHAAPLYAMCLRKPMTRDPKPI